MRCTSVASTHTPCTGATLGCQSATNTRRSRRDHRSARPRTHSSLSAQTSLTCTWIGCGAGRILAGRVGHAAFSRTFGPRGVPPVPEPMRPLAAHVVTTTAQSPARPKYRSHGWWLWHARWVCADTGTTGTSAACGARRRSRRRCGRGPGTVRRSRLSVPGGTLQ